MDRSDAMGRQMSALMDGKQQDIQERLEDAAIHLHKIKEATEKSEKVARIFQDQIPHQEIIEKKNTAKYHEAAKMSHQGFSLEEIAKRIDLPRGELELIVKVNRNRLVTEKSELPPIIQADETFEKVQVEPLEPAAKIVSQEEILPVANAGNKEAHIRPFVFRKIVKNKDLITELDLQR
jgi:hypothetical protein